MIRVRGLRLIVFHDQRAQGQPSPEFRYYLLAFLWRYTDLYLNRELELIKKELVYGL